MLKNYNIDRYLAGEPIEAKRDSALYVLKKTLRRYRLPAAIAAAFMVIVTTALVVSLTLWGRSARDATEANKQRDIADTRLGEVTAANSRLETQADQLRRRDYASLIFRATVACPHVGM